MSYAAVKPEFYEMMNPETPWHSGAPGWSTAPWPGWGENPALVGPRRLAVNGLGGGCGCTGMGQDAPRPTPPSEMPPEQRARYEAELRRQRMPYYIAGGVAVAAAVGAFLYFR